MTEHEQHGERLEHELDDMQQQADRVGAEIDETREQWRRRQRDSGVPGASGEPDEPDEDTGNEDEPPPEQQYPAKGG